MALSKTRKIKKIKKSEKVKMLRNSPISPDIEQSAENPEASKVRPR